MRSCQHLGDELGPALGVVRPHVDLVEVEVVGLGERFLDPVPRRVHLEAIAGFGRDECSLPRMVLDLEAELASPFDDRLVLVLVERDPEMVDAGYVPVPRLDDDVDGSAPQLDEAQAKAHRVEVLPGGARLEPLRALPAPPVTPDELESELPQVAPLEEPDLARHEVVVKQLHGSPAYESYAEESTPLRGTTAALCRRNRLHHRRRPRPTASRTTGCPPCRA